MPVERIATVAGLGFPVALAGVTVARAALYPTLWVPPASALAIGVAYALGLLLHLRHVTFAMRGTRPPRAMTTLAALVLLTLGGGLAHGPIAPALMPLLLVSILALVPLPLAGIAYATVLIAVQFVIAPTRTPTYSIFSALWASAVLYVPVRLASAAAALHRSQLELRNQAVVRERVRIDREIRKRLEPPLERIVHHGAVASAITEEDSVASRTAIGAAVADSREALADARRLVAGIRESTIRAELQAGIAILEAAGIVPVVALDPGADLDSVDDNARGDLRSVVARILESGRPSVIEVRASGTGSVEVRMAEVDAPVGAGGR